MTTYITKDSGERQEFDSGSVRDTQEGKPRYDLIPPAPMKRLAELYARGAEKYGEHNWTKGQPVSRFQSSLERHYKQWVEGETDEDHLAAVLWNTMAIMHFEDTDWNDKFDWTPVNRPSLDDESSPSSLSNMALSYLNAILDRMEHEQRGFGCTGHSGSDLSSALDLRHITEVLPRLEEDGIE